MRRMRGAQVGVELVGGVARAVNVQRLRHRPFVLAHLVAQVARFVDVVADEEHDIELARGDRTVRRVPALLVVLAGGNARRRRHRLVLGRRGARAADRADRAAGDEAVEPGAAAGRAIHLDVHRMRMLQAARNSPRRRPTLSARLRPAPSARQAARAAGRRRSRAVGAPARPDHHRVGARHAAGHAERERVADAGRPARWCTQGALGALGAPGRTTARARGPRPGGRGDEAGCVCPWSSPIVGRP